MPKKKKEAKEMKMIAPGILQKNEKTFYIVCKVSGKECYCNKERLDALAKKFGGIDKIQDNYVSRDAKRLLKAKLKPSTIAKLGANGVIEESKMIHKDKKALKAERAAKREETVAKKNKVPHDEIVLEPLTVEEIVRQTTKEDGTEGFCLRPKYFFDWRKCNDCRYVKHCKALCKVWVHVVPEGGGSIAKQVLAEMKKV